jgi:hypothetical protein
MIIDGNDLMKKVVRFTLKEKELLEQGRELMEKFETAQNLHNESEMIKINSQGESLQNKIDVHCLEKIVMMSMVVVNNPNFKCN